MGEREALRGVWAEHAARYPMMQPQDAAKLVYQGELGAGHLVKDKAAGLQFLREEQRCAAKTAPLLESVGGGLCRVYLGPAADAGISAETLYNLFLQCAGNARGSMAGLEQKLLWVEPAQMPFSSDAWADFLASYRRDGFPLVRHSAVYRNHYRPAYRLVEEAWGKYLPFFAAVDRLLEEKQTVTVAIDGNSGAGKSSLAALAQAVYGCAIYHMDDYFLPPERKTAARLAQPGGNVDYERFQREILAGLAKGGAFSYQPYCCRTGRLEAPVLSAPGRLRIVEGVYSLHPALRSAYDLKVFLSVSPKVQSARILHRSGPALHRRFLEEWIPLEERYFSGCRVRRQCQLIINAE